MRFIKRNTLILLITCAQLGLLVVGVGFLSQWLQRQMTELVVRQIDADNAALASQTSRWIGEMDLKQLQPQGEQWLRLQQVVENLRVANQGAVMVMDADTGKLICHPRLRSDLRLRHQDYGRLTMHLGASAAPLREAHGSGWYESSDGMYYAHVSELPELNAKLIVQQNAGLSVQSVASVLSLVRLMLLGGPFLYALLAGVAAFEVARRVANDGDDADVDYAARKELISSRNSLAFGLANLAELRDKETGTHLVRVRAFMRILAQELSAQHEELRDPLYVQDLLAASVMHDVGKFGVRESILLKPGRLTDDERHEMQKHTLVGDCYLTALSQNLRYDRFFQLARQMAASHHERWDGGGYPFGIEGEKIPLPARMVAVADVYDALTSGRTYRPRLTPDQARDLIASCANSQFDPQVVAAFLKHEPEFRKLAGKAEPPAEETADVVLFDVLRSRNRPKAIPQMPRRRVTPGALERLEEQTRAVVDLGSHVVPTDSESSTDVHDVHSITADGDAASADEAWDEIELHSAAARRETAPAPEAEPELDDPDALAAWDEMELQSEPELPSVAAARETAPAPEAEPELDDPDALAAWDEMELQSEPELPSVAAARETAPAPQASYDQDEEDASSAAAWDESELPSVAAARETAPAPQDSDQEEEDLEESRSERHEALTVTAEKRRPSSAINEEVVDALQRLLDETSARHQVPTLSAPGQDGRDDQDAPPPADERLHVDVQRHSAPTMAALSGEEEHALDDDDDQPAGSTASADSDGDSRSIDDELEERLQRSVRQIQDNVGDAIRTGGSSERPKRVPSPDDAADLKPGSREWMEMWQQIFKAQTEKQS